MMALQLTTVVNDVTYFNVYNDTTGHVIGSADINILILNNTIAKFLTTECGILHLSYRDITGPASPYADILFSINTNTFTCANNPVYTGVVTITVTVFESTIFPLFTCS